MAYDAAAEEQYERDRIAVKLIPAALLLFIPIVVGSLVAIHVKKDNAREAVLASLRQLTSDKGGYSVFVGGERAINDQIVVKALEELGSFAGHGHTHPIDPLPLEIRTTTNSLHLVVADDSKYPGEYWVFVPSDGFLGQDRLGLEIGRLKSDVFRPYSAKAKRKP
jgi:hypothetical protein